MISSKKVRKVEKVKNYILVSNQLVYHVDESILINGEQIIPNDVDLIGGVIDQDKFTYSRKSNHSNVIVNVYSGDGIELNGLSLQNFRNDKSRFGYVFNDEYDSFLVKVDLKNFSFDFSEHIKNENVKVLSNNFAVVFSKKCIKKINLDTGLTYWSIEPKIDRFENLNSLETDKIICGISGSGFQIFDLNEGNLLATIKTSPSYLIGSKKNNNLPESRYFVLDKKESTMISLYWTFCFKINLENNDVQVIDLEDTLHENGIENFRRSTDYAISETHIYTIGEVMNHDSHEAKGDRCILALNKDTLKVDWKYVFEDSSINTDCPKISDDGTLYQLDSEGTLHIFEKE